MHMLLLPLALLSWGLLSAWAARQAGSHGPVSQALVFLVLLPLPLIDELLARPQFEALCRAQTALVRHPALTAGRGVYRLELPQETVPGLLLPVRMQRWLYLDDETDLPLVSFNTLQAGPGKLARLAGQHAGPLTFDGGCGPVGQRTLLADLGLQERGTRRRELAPD